MYYAYVFRADVAYDYNADLDTIKKDTQDFHCDHSYDFLRKNERLKYSYCPQPPTKFDSQSESDYKIALAEFENRKKFVVGSQVKPNYTSIAHYFLIKNSINAEKWYFISDDDLTLQSSIFRILVDKFKSERALYFTCRYEKSLSLEEAGKESFKSRILLKNWAKSHEINNKSLWEIAEMKLESEINLDNFYGIKEGKTIRGNNPIKPPCPDKDEGIRWINLISHIRYMNNKRLAQIIMQVNGRAINNFFQEIRRRISILERPIVTARGDGKSYIYANYNPKYAQQIITIFRTFYNFCWVTKVGDAYRTPAQRIGLTDKKYEYKDIIYFR